MTAELRMLAMLSWVEAGRRGDPPLDDADLGLAVAVAQEAGMVSGSVADAGMSVAPAGYAFAAARLAPVVAILDAPTVRRAFTGAASGGCVANSQEAARIIGLEPDDQARRASPNALSGEPGPSGDR